MGSHNMSGPMDEVEQRLYPNIPYEQMTAAQREHVIKETKDLIFLRTGRRIP